MLIINLVWMSITCLLIYGIVRSNPVTPKQQAGVGAGLLFFVGTLIVLLANAVS